MAINCADCAQQISDFFLILLRCNLLKSNEFGNGLVTYKHIRGGNEYREGLLKENGSGWVGFLNGWEQTMSTETL